MKLTTPKIAPLLLTALVGCASQSPKQPAVALPQLQAPPPAAWAMEPVATPSYHQRLEQLFLK
ncbi:hypothetical protein P9292_11105 [Caballeronia sp. LZ001]|nr:hypothetical protein [Caballeronia sp. LZ001]MDR5800622.1 hypothetical protein [Caballeronia sp. LZ001]